jgi:DNA-binding LacI/PurR family transcriptional regulator
MATIYDVARESGFSLATISNVVNNGGRPVKPETRDKILATIQKLNYYPNAIARGLARQRTPTIGILFGVVETSEIVLNDYSLAILQAVLSVSAERGYNLTHMTQRWRSPEESLMSFRDGRTDGFLVVAPPTDTGMMHALATLEIPLVAVSWSDKECHIPSADIDDEFGARLLMDHLVDLGHTQIAHITGHRNLISGQIRERVYLESLGNAGIQADPEYLRSGRYSPKEGYEQTQRLLRLPNPPTAIFAANDEIAFGVIDAATEMGVEIPRQLSVVGVDDRPMAAVTRPALTTLRQPFNEVGKAATDLLIQRIDGEEVAHETLLFRPSLIMRSSTAPPCSKGQI